MQFFLKYVDFQYKIAKAEEGVIHTGFLRNPLPSPWASSANQNKKISLESKLSDEIFSLVCDPCRIQTCNPHIRSVVLYSVELMDRTFEKKRGLSLLRCGRDSNSRPTA